ncbi:MAG TPA: 2-phospho-L-lactate guanylyltransferase [Segeticoccus sp.]|nr:2-phospho-L-lactate guanylyltransferase [Segeticoccus sp.]
MTTVSDTGWQLVLPVKARTFAKSRLVPPGGVARDDLAHALARDTLAAVFAALPPVRVVVVTSDVGTAELAHSQGGTVVPDPGAGLNAAVAEGVRVVADRPESAVGVLLADLPALRPDDLAQALAAAARHERAFVPDAAGTGTVLLTAAAAWDLVPRFGPGSSGAHARTAARLDLDLPRLRTDVDDDASLRAAVDLGVGAATTSVLSGVALR